MRTSARFVLLLVASAAIAGASESCADPVHDQLVASLPPDPTPNGEFHRAGQPCLACHGPEGPAQTQFAVAGTIFWHPTADQIGVDQATVSIIDSLGANPQLTTNCVGNFFVKPEDWPGGSGPAFPLRVEIFKDGTKYSDTMTTQINRAGSCADCHGYPANYNSVGLIYTVPDNVATDPLPTDCPVNPANPPLGVGP
jgi:cytochrome c553